MRPKAESLLRSVVMAALISVAVAGCGAAVTGSSQTPPAGYAGYRWQVVEIDHAGRQTPVPARYAVYLQFGLTGQFGAHEPVNYHGGSYHSTSDGFTTSGMSSTLVGDAATTPSSCCRSAPSRPSGTASRPRSGWPATGSRSASATTCCAASVMAVRPALPRRHRPDVRAGP